MGEELIRQGRSLAETPTYSVASVITVLVFVCLLVQRSIYRFGRWLKKTRRKALFASLEKIKEELMLLGLISLLLAQWARWISEICVDSSLFSSRFYICSENDYGFTKTILFKRLSSPLNESDIPPKGLYPQGRHHCGEGREPFVSLEGLEQLHRFLFVLGITHVLYSCLAVGLAMSKIYSWRKWENQIIVADAILQAKKNKVMERQSTFVFHHTSHPWSRNRVLIWMCFDNNEKYSWGALYTKLIGLCLSLFAFLVGVLEISAMNLIALAICWLSTKLCFFRQFKSSIKKSDYLALRLGFITKHKLPLSYNFHNYMVRSMEDEFQGILGISWPLWVYAILCIFINIHGLNIYFWLSFIPAIIVMIVGTKLQHIVSSLALEIVEQAGPSITQVKPRDDLFWFRKPEILLRLIQFIIFQNAFEMATFIWSLWGLKERSCFMKNHYMIIIRLASGVLVQFWCSYSTVPLNVIVTQMGSRCKKALVAESVRESLHSWCKRVKDRSKRDSTARSVCSVDTATIDDERDEITVTSGTISHCSSLGSLNEVTVAHTELAESFVENPIPPPAGYSFRMEVYDASQPLSSSSEGYSGNVEETKVETLSDLFQKT